MTTYGPERWCGACGCGSREEVCWMCGGPWTTYPEDEGPRFAYAHAVENELRTLAPPLGYAVRWVRAPHVSVIDGV